MFPPKIFPLTRPHFLTSHWQSLCPQGPSPIPPHTHTSPAAGTRLWPLNISVDISFTKHLFFILKNLEKVIQGTPANCVNVPREMHPNSPLETVVIPEKYPIVIGYIENWIKLSVATRKRYGSCALQLKVKSTLGWYIFLAGIKHEALKTISLFCRKELTCHENVSPILCQITALSSNLKNKV